MKKLVSGVLFVLLASSTSLIAVPTKKTSATSQKMMVKKKKPKLSFDVESDDLEFYSITDISKSMLEKFLKGELPNAALECPEGAEIPLKIGTLGHITSQSEEHMLTNMYGQFYVRHDGDKFLFSKDAEAWKTLEEIFDLSMSVNMSIKKNKPKFSVYFNVDSWEDDGVDEEVVEEVK